MSQIGPTLETPRLILRPPEAADFEPWAAFAADPLAARFLGGPQSRPVAWRSMCTVIGAWIVNGFSMFSVIEKTSSRWIGRVGPWAPEAWPRFEVGWGLAQHAWGNGYAVEAATAAMDWVVDVMGWTEITHAISSANAPSQKVAQRLGAHVLREDMLPDPLNMAVEIWGQTRADWLARRT